MQGLCAEILPIIQYTDVIFGQEYTDVVSVSGQTHRALGDDDVLPMFKVQSGGGEIAYFGLRRSNNELVLLKEDQVVEVSYDLAS